MPCKSMTGEPKAGKTRYQLLNQMKAARAAGDSEKAEEIIQKYDLCKRTKVYISPVFGNIDPADIVEFMKERKMNKVRLQLQLHKFIWDPDKKGV